MAMDTIVAVATPPGRGGVGIVRLSGPLAYTIALHITKKSRIESRVIHFCSFYSSEGERLDKGILLYFKHPHSFTGEDVIEFQGHGAPIVLDRLVQEAVLQGARIANPGEFSERAFLNNRMDLTQAEAIADLINASSQTAARMAMRSLQGDFSKQIQALNDRLIHLRLYVEAAIDFPEEEIDFLSDGKVASMLKNILTDLETLRASVYQGVIIREGISVVIAGRPNAGKSTLINALAGREVAIVTPIPGTTRDVMREHVLLDEIPLHLIDTAGLRESDDLVEQEGIKRAWQEVRQADCLLMVIDACEDEQASNLVSTAIENELPPNVPVLRVYNKMDEAPASLTRESEAIYISAKTGEGLPDLKTRIKQMVGYQVGEGQFLARTRHILALDKARELLLKGQNQLVHHRALELLAEDLRLSHQSLGEITGEFSSDDLLGEIFSSFCIGK